MHLVAERCRNIVGPGPARAVCIGDGCGDKTFHVTPSTRALGKDKKCKDKNKNKGKPGEECEEKDEDGCCIDEEDGSNEAKTTEMAMSIVIASPCLPVIVTATKVRLAIVTKSSLEVIPTKMVKMIRRRR